jgi:hypothetical protein
VIVGTTANIIASREMASYLVEAVTRLANEATAKVPAMNGGDTVILSRKVALTASVTG